MMDSEQRSLHEAAYEASGDGRLDDAARLFGELIGRDPGSDVYHYMKGLAHKYRREWAESLQCNLRALALAGGDSEGALWNAAIAATALGDWPQVRRLWTQQGLRLPEGDGPIDGNFGVASVRLNAWEHGETLYARRLDPARARLLNVPLPETGFCFGDIVLNDGACTGRRPYGDGDVPVFNVLQRLQASEFQTFAVFVHAETLEDINALCDCRLPGLGWIEDWTDSIRHYCLRCSYGAPHCNGNEHGGVVASNDSDGNDWQPDRNLGIAAQSRQTVNKLLESWAAQCPGRWIDAIETREAAPSEPQDGSVWWRGPEGDGDEDQAQDGP